ncbi:MAG: flagellar hook-basal body complex protein, partial [Myxococcota bacterium]|nr:flagellar hook-basal body complex protein [Myxococcota bacterium]
MSIFSSLYTGMSGMRVNETGIAVTGDNIANMNTIGFKASRPVFADILNATVMGSPGSANVGQGALAQAVQRIQGQGAMLQTGVTSDLAIGGNGFFICRGEL